MTALYKRVEEREEVKPVLTSVKFNADYDITDVCTRFGNWSRLGLYLRQNTPSYYHSQPKKLKEICSDNDAMKVNKAFLSILNTRTKNAKDIYDVLILSYFGEKKVIDDVHATTGIARRCKELHEKGEFFMLNAKDWVRNEIYLVTPLSVKDIALNLGFTWDKAKELKSSGEDFLTGYFAAIKSSTGDELDMLQNIRLLK